MISKYFLEFEKNLLGAAKPSGTIGKTGKSEKAVRKAESSEHDERKININNLRVFLSRIIHSDLTIDSLKPIDSSGFSPDGADFIAYKKYCADIVKIMNNHVPYELVYGTFYVVPFLDKKSLAETLNRVSVVKKLNYFAGGTPDLERGDVIIPAVVLAFEGNYNFLDLKNDIINYYMTHSVDFTLEMDIFMIPGKGLVVKNWKEQRNFVVLETKNDTSMWFFILMNEYMDYEKRREIDFRKYVKNTEVYKEY